MRVRNEEAYKSKKEIVMESCFNCFAENGLHGTGIAALSQYCHLSKTAFYIYPFRFLQLYMFILYNRKFVGSGGFHRVAHIRNCEICITVHSHFIRSRERRGA